MFDTHSEQDGSNGEIAMMIAGPIKPINRKERKIAIKAAVVCIRNTNRVVHLCRRGQIKQANAISSGLSGYLSSRSISAGNLTWALLEIARPVEGET